MKVDRDSLESSIEAIVADGVINGKEIDVTTKEIMEEIEILIRVAERSNGKYDF